MLEFVTKDQKYLLLRHPAWPDKRLCGGEAAEIFERAFLLWANSVVCEYCDSNFDPASRVECVFKPKRMAIAKASCPALMSLVLAPDSLKVNSCHKDKLLEEPWDKRARVHKVPTQWPNQVFCLAPLVSEGRCGAFWCVEPAPENKKANMVWAVASYVCHTGVELTMPKGLEAHQCERHRFSKKANPPALAKDASDLLPHIQLSEEATTQIVRVPVLVNSKPLNVGDVLYYRVEEAEAEEEENKKKRARDKAPEPITIDATLKRRKAQLDSSK